VEPAEALRHAVKDMLLPPSSRDFVRITTFGRGACRYEGRGNNKLVYLDGDCPDFLSGK